MRFEFRYNVEDFDPPRKPARSLHRRRAPSRWMVGSIITLLLLTQALILIPMVYLVLTASSFWLCAAILPATCVFFVLGGIIKKSRNTFSDQAAWNQSPLSKDLVIVALEPQQLLYSTPRVTQKCAARHIVAVWDYPGQGLYFSAGGESFHLPDRCFETPEQREACWAIAQQWMREQ